LLAAIGAVIAAKQFKSKPESKPAGGADPIETTVAAIPGEVTAETKLPRLLELGSVSCIPCKLMKPILDELEIEYKGSMSVDFIDVWEDESAAEKYGVSIIPTQIFFAADGKELFRHEGFFSKEAILLKWQEFCVNLVLVEAK
jgi:thioredoxin 1